MDFLLVNCSIGELSTSRAVSVSEALTNCGSLRCFSLFLHALSFGPPSAPHGRHKRKRGTGMSFGIYIIGFLILIGGLILAAVILHMGGTWIAVGAIVLLGLAILKGVQATRGKDPSH